MALFLCATDTQADGSWTLTLQNGTTKTDDFLVLSTGQFFRPYIPDIPGLNSFQGKVLHSFYVRDAKELFSGKQVVVVGGRKSAHDIMKLAVENGGKVTGVMREISWTMPLARTFYGRKLLAWITCKVSEVLNPGRTSLRLGLIGLANI